MPDLFCDWPKDAEAQFWAAYPRRVSKIAAMKALAKVRERGDVPWAKITEGIERYKAWLGQRNEQTWRPEPKHPATWLNGGCWDDEFGGDYHEANRSISTAAAASLHGGFRLGPKPRDILPEGGGGDVRLLAKE